MDTPCTKTINVDEVFYWECRQRWHKKNGTGEFPKCPAKCKTIEKCEKHYIATSSEHNHAPDVAERIRLENSVFLRRQASSTNDTTSQIIQTAKAKIPTVAITTLPTLNAMKKIVQRKRRHDLPTEPATLTDVFIPDKLKKTISNQLFLGTKQIWIFQKTKLNFCQIQMQNLTYLHQHK